MKKLSLLILILVLAVVTLALSSCAGCFGTPDRPDGTSGSIEDPDNNKPNDNSGKPSDDSGKPGDNTGKPGDNTGKPGDDTGKPGDDSGKPGDDSGKPGDDSGKPGDDSGKPGDDSGKPGDDTGKPGDDTGKPGEDTGNKPHIHSFDNWTTTKEATCTEDGTRVGTCACGEKKTETIPATGHTFGEWTVVKAATCTEDGVKEAVCACGEKKTETISAKGHSFGEWTVVKAATCTEDGTKEAVCACGEKKTEIIPANGHIEVVDAAKDATCTEAGLTEGKHCSACGAVTVKQEVIPARGHNFSEWTIVKEATCTETGTKVGTCACGEKKTEIIPANGHIEVVDAAKDATCTEAGLTEGKHCSVCSTVLVEQKVIPAEGHNFVNGVCSKCNELKTSEGLKYTLNFDGQSYIVSGIGSCTDTEIVIPSTYNGKPVTSIGYKAFKDCTNLTSITIPDSVTNIGSDAFSGTAYYNNESNWVDGVLYIGNHLIKAKTSISGSYTIKSGTKCIANDAFRKCTGLTSITIPNSVTGIGSDAFYYCTRLTSVTIPDSMTSIGSNAFSGCTGLSAVYITDIAKWCGISFGADATNPLYYAHNLYLNGTLVTDLVIPDSVTSIGQYAFYKCYGLTSVTIGKGVKRIENNAFENCTNLKAVYITDIAKWCGISFRGYYSTPLYYAHNLYLNGTLVTDLVIPDSVTSIGEGTFEGCTSLTSVTILDSVTSIGSGAFQYCTGLTSITIPDSVTSISSSTFYDTAYYNNESNWVDGVLYIGNHLIKAKTSISGSYTIKSGTKCIADSAFSNCKGLTSITIPGSVTSIGSSAFYQCTGLTLITIPDSVTSIGNGAFSRCTDLASITISDSVISIGYETFEYTAYYYNDSNWIDGVLYIGNHLIKAKNSVSGSYTIKVGTKCIAASAFRYCTGLTSVTIPDSVTSIDGEAFSFCTGLTSITFKGTKAQWNAITKGSSWDNNSGSYTVHCTDGDISK